MKLRFKRRARTWLVLAAALPLIQLGACGAAINQSAFNIALNFPGTVLNAIGDASLTLFLKALGINTSGLFRNDTNSGGSVGS